MASELDRVLDELVEVLEGMERDAGTSPATKRWAAAWCKEITAVREDAATPTPDTGEDRIPDPGLTREEAATALNCLQDRPDMVVPPVDVWQSACTKLRAALEKDENDG